MQCESLFFPVLRASSVDLQVHSDVHMFGDRLLYIVDSGPEL